MVPIVLRRELGVFDYIVDSEKEGWLQWGPRQNGRAACGEEH